MFKKIKNSLFSPTTLFQEVQSEQSILPAFLYVVKLTIINLVILIFTLFLLSGNKLFNSSEINSLSEMTGLGVVGITVIIIVLALLIPIIILFLASWTTHILMPKQNRPHYRDSYKAFAYGITPAYLLSYVPVINIFVGVWVIILQIKGLMALHSVRLGRTAVAYVFGGVLSTAIFTTIPVVAVVTYMFLTFNGGEYIQEATEKSSQEKTGTNEEIVTEDAMENRTSENSTKFLPTKISSVLSSAGPATVDKKTITYRFKVKDNAAQEQVKNSLEVINSRFLDMVCVSETGHAFRDNNMTVVIEYYTQAMDLFDTYTIKISEDC